MGHRPTQEDEKHATQSLLGFVSGHDFSRAVKARYNPGTYFTDQPGDMLYRFGPFTKACTSWHALGSERSSGEAEAVPGGVCHGRVDDE